LKVKYKKEKRKGERREMGGKGREKGEKKQTQKINPNTKLITRSQNTKPNTLDQ